MWSAVGSPVLGYAAANTVSVTVNPTAIGDIMVGVFGVSGYGGPPAPVGGGVTTWTQAGQSGWGYLGGSTTQATYYGVVTATGAQTLTFNNVSGAAASEIIVQQFHCVDGSNIVNDPGAAGSASASGYSFPTAGTWGTSSPSTSYKNLFVGGGNWSYNNVGLVLTTTFTGGVVITGYMMQFAYYIDATNPTAYQPTWTSTTGLDYSTCVNCLYVLPARSVVMIIGE